jgi:hypothetical protein
MSQLNSWLLKPFSDNESPRVRDCPQSFEVQLLPGEVSRTVSWAEPIFTDNVGVDRVYKSKVSRFSENYNYTVVKNINIICFTVNQLVRIKNLQNANCEEILLTFQLIKRTKHEELCHHYINYDVSVRKTSANTHSVLSVWLFCYFLSLRSMYPNKTLLSILSE